MHAQTHTFYTYGFVYLKKANRTSQITLLFPLPDLSVAVVHSPPPIYPLSLFAHFFLPVLSTFLLHVVFSHYLQDLWKVGCTVTSSCHGNTVQMSACGKDGILTGMFNTGDVSLTRQPKVESYSLCEAVCGRIIPATHQWLIGISQSFLLSLSMFNSSGLGAQIIVKKKK